MTTNAIYTNPTGWQVREFSHSQYQTYKQCGKKFYFERVLGWRQKQGAIMDFGKDVQSAVEAFFTDRRDPVETFEMLWAPREADTKLAFDDKEPWSVLNAAGVGLMNKFRATWDKYPPRNPVFYNFKNALKVKDDRTGASYQTIPDLSDADANGPYMADLKCMGGLLDDSVPGMVINDQQLRTQAAVFYKYRPEKTYRVALWNFCRKPKQMNAPTKDEIFSVCGGTEYTTEFIALFVAHETSNMNFKDCGAFLGIANPEEVNKEFKRACKADQALKPLAESIAQRINDAHRPEYVIQWVEGTMTKEHAEEALAEELSVVSLIQQEYFPRVGGVRFPNNQCTWCSHRGLCMEELYGAREEYSKITADELVRFEESALSELD